MRCYIVLLGWTLDAWGPGELYDPSLSVAKA